MPADVDRTEVPLSQGPWFIYTLTDPREATVVRYVGVTNDVHRRAREHRNRALSGKDSTRCGNWKRKLLGEGVLPSLAVVESGYGSNWAEAETKWISHFRSEVGDRLCNLTEGGQGARGHHCSEETRTKLRTLKIGSKASEEARASMRRAQAGRKASPETKAKMSLARRGRVKSPEHRENIRRGLMGNTNAKNRSPDSPDTTARRVAAAKASWSRRKAEANQ